MSNEPEQPEEIEAKRGIRGVEESDSAGNSRLPFDPRRRGPKDLLGDLRAWSYRRRFWIAGAIVLVGIGYYVVSPDAEGLPSLPQWLRVALVAGAVSIPLGIYLGRRVGSFLSPSRGYLVSQLNARDGDQDLVRISEERHRDLRVLDHAGEERPRDYLNRVVVNGERALECDAYYPRENVAVSSWQAGKSNHEIREHEHMTDQIKTELDRAAQAGMKAEMEKPQEVAAEVRRHSALLIGAVEGVLNPSDVDLEAIKVESEAERMEGSAEDHLADLEAEHELLGGSRDGGEPETNGQDDGRLEEMEERREGLSSMARDRLGSDGGGDDE